jgi:metal-responsive CopG/Arc/MetJ family transcriptional regulator
MILSYSIGGETMKRRRVAVTISLPPDIAKDYERIAGQEAKNKSQLFRDMFSLYREKALEKEFLDLQRYGAKRAREKGILTEKDVEKIVFEGR